MNLSTAEAIVPVVELFEWSRGVIALHSKVGSPIISSIGVVASSVTTYIFSSTLCHSKNTTSMGSAAYMKSRRWWYALVGGLCCIFRLCMCCGGKGRITGG